MPDRWVSADIAAAMTGLSVRTLRRRAAQGALRIQRTADKHVSYLAADLEALADKTDTTRTPVRLEESDAAALIRDLTAQVGHLSRLVGQLEGELKAVQLERDRLLAPPEKVEELDPKGSNPERARPWWRRWWRKERA